MYKPRIVEFTWRGGFDRKANVDTRKGMFGFYPGDIIAFDGWYKQMVIGVCVDAGIKKLGIILENENKLSWWGGVDSSEKGQASEWGNNHTIKLIKRHATPELIKQMKQV
jgi:hypothetical protein